MLDESIRKDVVRLLKDLAGAEVDESSNFSLLLKALVLIEDKAKFTMILGNIMKNFHMSCITAKSKEQLDVLCGIYDELRRDYIYKCYVDKIVLDRFSISEERNGWKDSHYYRFFIDDELVDEFSGNRRSVLVSSAYHNFIAKVEKRLTDLPIMLEVYKEGDFEQLFKIECRASWLFDFDKKVDDYAIEEFLRANNIKVRML